MIPYGHQTIDKKDIEAVSTALTSEWLTQGPTVSDFENRIAKYCGSVYATVVNSGTAALHCAYYAAGIGKDDEVIMPAQTFVATANAALYLGAKPVFCDIDLTTYNIDTKKIEALINEKTKAIVPVHIGGNSCDMDKILAIAKKHRLLVIEDACHALGSSYKNKKIGGISDMTVFSFHPVKSITTGEGGVVCTNNKDYYKAMCSFRTHGIVNEERLKDKTEGPWYFEMQSLGYNYRINDMQCALGISQLEKLDEFIERRKIIAKYYNNSLKNVDGLILPDIDGQSSSSLHLYIVRVDKNIRKDLFVKLKASGIGVQVHYIPVYHHPFYRENGFKNFFLPNTEIYYQTCLSLPIFPGLQKKEMEYVVTKLKELLLLL